MAKGIITAIHIANKEGKTKKLNVSLKNRAVDIEQARMQIKAKYKAKHVYFNYDSNE